MSGPRCGKRRAWEGNQRQSKFITGFVMREKVRPETGFTEQKPGHDREPISPARAQPQQYTNARFSTLNAHHSRQADLQKPSWNKASVFAAQKLKHNNFDTLIVQESAILMT